MSDRRGPILYPFPFILILLFIILILFAPLLIYFFFFTALSIGTALSMSLIEIFLLFMAIMMGSAVNIPIKEYNNPENYYLEREVSFFGIRFRMPVTNQKTVICVNIGGAVIPAGASLYFIISSLITYSFVRLEFILTALVTLSVVILVSNKFAKIVENVGITLPMFLPPSVTVLTSLIASYIFSCPLDLLGRIAFSTGVLGVLIGADLLNLKKIRKIGAPMISIGGAGSFDGIFITGVISAILSVLFMV